MKINEIINKLNYELLTNFQINENLEANGVYISDLLSDVIGNAQKGNIWVTLQGHINIVAVAVLKELPLIIISKNGTVEENTIQKANEEDIILLKSQDLTYQIACKLYKLGL